MYKHLSLVWSVTVEGYETIVSKCENDTGKAHFVYIPKRKKQFVLE